MTKTAPQGAPLDAKEARSRSGGPSFSLANRLMRLVWMAGWLLLARWTPPLLHRWRAIVLKLFGAKLGRNCRVHASVKIWHPRNLELGDNVLIGPGTIIYNQGRITIGTDCVISQRAHLCASTHDPSDPHFQLLLRPITLAQKCWIATEAFVGPGVTIGEGAVIGARAALFEDAEEWMIYRGNPATRLKPRAMRAGEA